MHDTARMFGRLFFDTYLGRAKDEVVLDLGSFNVNGSLREEVSPSVHYIGLDVTEGPGVDIVLQEPYTLPIDSASADFVVSSSCFEHAEHFWLLFDEALRILKPGGLFYVNAPSNGPYHRYPLDCWRFYPDAGIALERWGRRLGYSCLLLESFVAARELSPWNDFVAVFLRDESQLDRFPSRMCNAARGLTNLWRRDDGGLTLRREISLPEDLRLLKRSRNEVERLTAELAEARSRLAQLERGEA